MPSDEATSTSVVLPITVTRSPDKIPSLALALILETNSIATIFVLGVRVKEHQACYNVVRGFKNTLGGLPRLRSVRLLQSSFFAGFAHAAVGKASTRRRKRKLQQPTSKVVAYCMGDGKHPHSCNLAKTIDRHKRYVPRSWDSWSSRTKYWDDRDEIRKGIITHLFFPTIRSSQTLPKNSNKSIKMCSSSVLHLFDGFFYDNNSSTCRF